MNFSFHIVFKNVHQTAALVYSINFQIDIVNNDLVISKTINMKNG